MRLPITIRPFNSGGPGGQHSNKTLNAIEASVTLPDGRVIRASATESRSQHVNKKRALAVLRARVWEAVQPERQRPDVSQRVRTYHAVRNDVIDHATKEHRRWDEVLDGHGFDELVDARRQKLEMDEALR